MNKCIKVNNLSIFENEKTIVDNINFSLTFGKTLALLGPSGSGKSLIATAIMGYVASNLRLNADIAFENINQKQDLAFIMQNPRTAFNPLFTISNCILESLKAKNIKRNDDKINEVLKSVELDKSILKLYAHQCSGGMLQRVMIAIALLSDAKFIIADEPTSDLDLLSQKAVLDILKKLNIGLLLITHDFGVVAHLADDVCVIESGRILEKNTCINLFKSPKTQLSKNLINAHLALYGDFND